jgi:hypothetical protein
VAKQRRPRNTTLTWRLGGLALKQATQ